MAHNRMSKALKRAIKNGLTDRVETLVKKRANIMYTKTEDEQTALMLASNEGRGEVMLMLVDMGYDRDMEYWDPLVQLALYKAVSNGYINSAKVLLDKGADINMKNLNGDTLLLKASNLGQTEMVKMFLEKGADVNARNHYGRTPIIDASSWGRTDIVSILLDNGADVNASTTTNGMTALILACEGGHDKIVSMLIDRGADINAKNHNGYTPLMLASNNGKTEIVTMLLEKRSNVNLTSDTGYTALMMACREEHKEITELLLENGADVNAVTKSGYTALELASIKRCFPDSDHNKDIVTLLKKYIRRTELMNQTLETALVIKKGSTQKGDKPLMTSAHKDTIHRIATFF